MYATMGELPMKNNEDKRRTRLLRLQASLHKRPIIASLKGMEDACTSAQHGVKVCFYLKGNIFELKDIVSQCKKQEQMLLVHVDLISGIAKDPYGMEVLALELGIDGILTTRGHLISAAQKMGMLGVQRLFMLDSEALRTGLEILRSNKPDALEILPALVFPSISPRLPNRTLPIIAGGLVETKNHVREILQPPVLGLSTSKTKLWDYEIK